MLPMWQQVRAAMAKDRGADKLRNVLRNLIEDNILGKPLEKSAQALDVESAANGETLPLKKPAQFACGQGAKLATPWPAVCPRAQGRGRFRDAGL